MSATLETAPEATAPRAGDEILLGFTVALRAAGVAVTQDRAQGYLEAVAALGLDDPAAVRLAGHATLCGSPDDLERHDRVFEEWFSTALGTTTLRPRPSRPVVEVRQVPTEEPGSDGDGAQEDGEVLRATASDREVLRQRDVATLSPGERLRLAALFAALPVALPRRSALRRTPHRRGEVDISRTLRASLRRMGEPSQIERRRRGHRHRRVVLLIDVSGSMSAYADPFLRLAHRFVAAAPAGGVEVFSLGTRLTRLTPGLRRRDPDHALASAGELVPDWSGGTRLGETLQAFVRRWGQRGMARGAVVVVLSDGWERGGTDELRDAVARLHLLAHRLVWVNPHRGKQGYAPVQSGIAAVLPYVDDFLAGHTLATFEELVEVVRGA